MLPVLLQLLIRGWVTAVVASEYPEFFVTVMDYVTIAHHCNNCSVWLHAKRGVSTGSGRVGGVSKGAFVSKNPPDPF